MNLFDLLRATAGGQPPVPAAPPGAGDGPPVAAPGAPAMGIAPPAQPAPAAPPGAGGSPPDMMQLYEKLVKDSERNNDLRMGATLLAAGFAQPQNRSALINAAFQGGGGGGGGGGSSNPQSVLSTMLALRKDTEAQRARAQQMARLPLLAKQYGLDMNTVNMLYETGKLDELIAGMAKPNRQIITGSNGEVILVDGNTGQTINTVTPANPNKDKTSDMKHLDAVNAERAAKGLPPMGAEEWLSEQNKSRGTNINIGDKTAVKAGELAVKQINDESIAAESSQRTIEQLANARESLGKGVITGSLLSTPNREARKIVAGMFNFRDEAVDNTDVFLAQMKEVVLPRVKALGTGNAISNADREFIEKAVGASDTLTPQAVMRIIQIIEKGERNSIARYNKRVEEFRGTDPEAGKYLRVIQPPEPRGIRPEIVEHLRQNPDTAKQFDDFYGAGASTYFLGKPNG